MKDNIIIALDFPDFDSARQMVNILGDQAGFYKIGLEMMASGDYFKMIDFLKNNDKKVFADLKLYDIGKTMSRTIKNLAQYDIDFLTIHAASREIMEQAAQAKENIKLLAVTVLTCLDQDDLSQMGFDQGKNLQQHVISRAKLAIESNIDGVVASAQEAQALRSQIGQGFDIVTPGIRLAASDDDQKRVVTPKDALAAGASHLVIGRPVARSQDPSQSLSQIISSIS